MDVLSPNLIWIDKRCYRVANYTTNSSTVYETNKAYEEEDLYGEDEEPITDDYIMEKTDDNRLKTVFHVPNIFYGSLIGKQGSTRKRIETETKTQIKIPSFGAKESYITIIGNTREDVASARRTIETHVRQARRKQKFTHFIGIPLNIRETFDKFKEDILNGPAIYGLDKDIFNLSSKIHITIGMLSLMDKADRDTCKNLFIQCQENIIKPILAKYGKLKIEISELDIMNDDPSSVKILYAKVKSEPLQEIADKMFEFFVNNGYMYSQYNNDHVKLHITLINTRYRNKEEDYKNTKNRDSFDARDLIEKYKNYNFGLVDLTEMHLSQLHTATIDKYYEATSIIKM